MSDDLFRTTVAVVSKRHRDQIMVTAAMRLVAEALEKTGSNLPGMKMAIAIAQSMVAEEQISLSLLAYREAAKAGVDLTAVTAIYTQSVSDTDEFELVVESGGDA